MVISTKKKNGEKRLWKLEKKLFVRAPEQKVGVFHSIKTNDAAAVV